MSLKLFKPKPLKGTSHAETVVVSNVWPIIEGGRYAVKKIVGEPLEVWADVFKDGHDVIDAVLKWRRQGTRGWSETRMHHHSNDRWTATFTLDEPGMWEFAIEAWCDDFLTWHHDWEKKFAAREKTGDKLQTEILEGAIILENSALLARKSADRQQMLDTATALREATAEGANSIVGDARIQALMEKWPNRSLSTTSQKFPVNVDRERARFSAWYEFFPRGAEGRADKHSTFQDCLERLEYAQSMGFDVIYFPPIHPIGRSHRKGRNNTLKAGKNDPGSPWAIGAEEGGHYDVHPELGKMKDFVKVVTTSRKMGMEIALDFAINCSPDHPYVKEHPDWFYQRPDGTIKYAENPPKKYQDIYPLNFHCEDWENLWKEMVRIVMFWAEKGVRIFRVDNPHTKPVAFWEYLMAQVRRHYPDVLFLAEAFTSPRMMEMLGKIGFSQSYTYFTWRVNKQEIMEYVGELTQGEMQHYYRGNFWPNTPDILVPPLVDAEPGVFKARATLAAMLMPSWGMYSGYEFCENKQSPVRAEYDFSEKYELKDRDWSATGIRPFIQRLNRIRLENPAFREYSNVRFLHTENEKIIAWIKGTADRSNQVLVVVNLDSEQDQSGTVHVAAEELGLPAGRSFTVHDLMNEKFWTWRSGDNYVKLTLKENPCHIFRIES